MQTINKRVDYVIDVPDFGTPLDMGQLVDIVKRSGSHFFDRDTMRFFKSRLDAYTFAAADGWYFVTSEQQDYSHPRLYTVRQLRIVDAVPNDGAPGTRDLRLVELDGFQAYATLGRARTAARKAATMARALCTACRLRVSLQWRPSGVCDECTERAERYAAKAVAQ